MKFVDETSDVTSLKITLEGKKSSRAFPKKKKKKKQEQKHPRTKEYTQFNQIDHNLICR